MNTAEVAARIGTTARQLRRFLRSKKSTYQAVGSTSRYDFDEPELPELERRFKKWADGKTTPTPKTEGTIAVRVQNRVDRDREVWAKEGLIDARGRIIMIQFEDLRDPDVLRKVREKAAAQERRLEQLLLARGMHISQGWVSSNMALSS